MYWIQRLASSLRTRKELEFHLEMRARTSNAATAEEARRQALERFGSVTRTKEACRDQSTFTWVAALGQDLRYAARNMRKNPGFTAGAAACMALGIGAACCCGQARC